MQMQCTADDVKVDEQTVRSGNSNHTAVAIPEQPDRINLPMQYLFLIGLPRLSPLFVILRFPRHPDFFRSVSSRGIRPRKVSAAPVVNGLILRSP